MSVRWPSYCIVTTIMCKKSGAGSLVQSKQCKQPVCYEKRILISFVVMDNIVDFGCWIWYLTKHDGLVVMLLFFDLLPT